MESLHIIAVTIGLGVSYLLIIQIFGYFFEGKFQKIPKQAPLRFLLILAMSVVANKLALSIPDPELGNRVLHGLGGGFLAFVVCYFAAKDMKLKVNKFQFFLMSFLIVAALGILNEVTECILQNVFHLRFSTNINDTWFDLISNTIGTLVAAMCFVPLFGAVKKD